MKKKLSLLLALLMLLLCVASCKGDDTPTESSDNPSADSTSDNTSSGDESQNHVAIEYETVVSVGKPYTVSFPAADQYADSYGTELCDGLYAPEGAGYTDEKFCGFTMKGQTLQVLFDLGEDGKQVYKFGVSYFNTTDAGIGPLSTSRVYYSNDGENWERSGFLPVASAENGVSVQTWVELKAPVDARYVRFDLKGQSSWLFLDELTIIANVAGSSAGQNYLQELAATYQNQKLSANDIKLGTALIDRTQEEVVVSKNHSYSVSRSASKSFPDKDHLLTDGSSTGTSFESGAYVGYEGGKALTIDVSLGKVTEGLANFELSMYQLATLRYMLPYYVDFLVSEDGQNFERVGRVYAPGDLSVTNFTFALHLTKGVSAKVVRFSLPDTDSDCFLMDEASVSYYGVNTAKPLYDPLKLPTVTGAQYHPNGSSKETNLVRGLPYQIVSAVVMDYAAESAHNTPASAGVLTDGKYSPNTTFDNGYWNRTRSGTGRKIYFDLGYNCSITGFKIDYLSLNSYGINVPGLTSLYLSEDGINWYAVGTAQCAIDKTFVGSVAGELRLEQPLEARFAYISFPVIPHAYADEIELYGTTAITSKTVKLSSLSTKPVTENSYCAPSDQLLGGVSDLALIYYNIIKSDEDFYLPYVAYLDQEGNIKDTLFDGFLFLPSVRKLATGGLPYASTENPTKLADWKYQFDTNFTEGRDFDALNKTVAKVKQALSLPADYKVKVYATIMWPSPTATDFGDIDGDGVSENLSKMEDLEKVMSVFMDWYLQAFADANYENLTFDGFYWFEEAVGDTNDIPRIQLTASVAESKGSQLFWIPYNTAPGFSDWNSYGFSVACMQPNYVFRDNTPLSQLYNAVNYIRTLGMGIELEIDDTTLSQLNFYKRYMRYLGYGIEAGYMKDCIHMYYQAGQVYYNACYADTYMARHVYDATYQFIKGTLTVPEKLADTTATCEKNGVLTGQLLPDDDRLLTTQLTVSTEHGSLTIAPNGAYTYIPHDGFTGTDSFSFSYSDYLTWSEDTTVTITVN